MAARAPLLLRRLLLLRGGGDAAGAVLTEIATARATMRAQLRRAALRTAAALQGRARALRGERIAVLAPPSAAYVAAQAAVWACGAVFVPLAPAHPTPEQEYIVRNAGCAALVADAALLDTAQLTARAAGVPLLCLQELEEQASTLYTGPYEGLDDDDGSEQQEEEEEEQPPHLLSAASATSDGTPAMFIYTSGTSGRPKGVVYTHGMLASQCDAIARMWRIGPGDAVLHVLPLHHVHGVVNALLCPLVVGAHVRLAARFDAAAFWRELRGAPAFNVLMAVPTMYEKLLAEWETLDDDQRAAVRAGCSRVRLMISGSAQLRERTSELWRARTGHRLLERYGMTETGMVLSQTLAGQRAGVGVPMPSTRVRLVDESGALGDSGELQVRGSSVFRQYWGRPAETAAAFTPDGWFRTGDVARRTADGTFVIMGRASMDFIKTGGFKVSALEVERELLEHPDVAECAVVGLPSEEWGQRVCAVVVPRDTGAPPLTQRALQAWSGPRLAGYKTPRELVLVPELPRNTLGKVEKKRVLQLAEQQLALLRPSSGSSKVGD